MESNGDKRRKNIVLQLKRASAPLSGQLLGKMCGVSRQIIVQDIAILRKEGYNILSTTRGYCFDVTKRVSRTVKVRHTNEETENELLTIVELGGKVLNVSVNHRIYGKLTAALNIQTLEDVQIFMKNIREGKSTPLMNITSGYHFHCIEADSVDTLDKIETALRENHYLTEVLPYEKDTL